MPQLSNFCRSFVSLSLSSFRAARRRVAVVSLAAIAALCPVTTLAQGTPEPQATPALGGSFVADPAIPTVISPSSIRSEFFVLNKDFSLLTHSTVDSSLNGSCAAAPGFSATSTTPRTLINDTQNAYFTGQSTANANSAVAAFSFLSGSCKPTPPLTIAGGTPSYTLTSNDTFHARLYVLSAFNGNGPDTLTQEQNLNDAIGAQTNTLLQIRSLPLDTGGQYTSMVTDTLAGAQGYGLTAITELKTSTSPGNLWVYNPAHQALYKILGPGGVPLPAVTSFIIPAQTDGGGSLLVLVNQDNLTATNLSNPPQDTTPFTIIDLGQLIQTFSIDTSGGTVTLPFVTSITATTPYFAMLGAAYNPVTRLVYAVVGGGSLTGVTGSVISYDPFHPGSPSETVVADISSIPFNFGSYPQLALSAAAGTLQILTPAPSSLYSVGILGTGNTAVAVPGSTFPDSNFQPTYIAANPLLGETYVASASGQVDILKNPAGKPAATLSLQGPDIAVTSQSYSLRGTGAFAVDDTALRAAPVTVTATLAGGGTPFTVSGGTYANFGINGTNIPITFPALGVYTLVASVPATANYPAISSNAVNVTVASNFIAGVYPTTLSITVPSNPTTTAVNVLVNLGGSTYAPTGHIDVKDGNGNIVGTTYFTGGALVQPTTIAVTLVQGVNTISATYSGDAQNAPTTSPTTQVTVGTTVTPTLKLTAPASAYVGNTVMGNVTFRSTTTNVPTGFVTIYGLLNGSSTPMSLAIATAAQAFTAGGANFTFNAPASGTYEIYASYAGDTNYASAVTAQQSLVTNPIPVNTTTVLTGGMTQAPGVPFNITVKLSSPTSQATPTGNVVVTAVLNSTGASTTISTFPATQAYASGGYAAQVVIPTAGSYTVTANYSGDANFNGSSNSIAVTVGATTISTTVTLTGAATQAAGVAFPLTVKLATGGTSQANPTGNVVITAIQTGGATTTLATVTAAQALATGGYVAMVTLPAAGSYNLTAAYAGDTNFGASSGALAVTVTSTVTPTTLAVSGPSNAAAGASFIVTATLRATGSPTATITGNVTLVATPTGGGAAINLATAPATQVLVSGGKQFTVSLASVGTYTITATYAGDTNFSASTGAIQVVVGVTTTTLTISGPATGSTATPYPLMVTLGGATSAANGVISTSATLTSIRQYGTTIVGGTAAGGETVPLTLSDPGTYTITATYSGDGNFGPSVSTSLTVVVTTPGLITTTTSISAPSVVQPNTPFIVTAKLFPASGPPVTGEVQVDYEGILKTNISGIFGKGSGAAAQAGGVQITGQLPDISGGYRLTVGFNGDSNYGSTGPAGFASAVVFTLEPTKLTLTPATTVYAGSATPLLVNLAPGNPNPTGSITVTSTLNGAAGPTGTVTAVSASTGGTGLNLTFSTVGTYTVSGVYAGDQQNGGSNATATVIVLPPPVAPTYTLALDNPAYLSQDTPLLADNSKYPNTVAAGLTLTAFAGYTTPIALTATGNMDSLLQFSIVDNSGNPVTTVVPTAAGAHVSLKVAYSATTSNHGPELPGGSGRSPAIYACGLLGCIVAGLGRRKLKRIRSLSQILVACVVLMAAVGLSGFGTCDGPKHHVESVQVTGTPVNNSQGAGAQTLTVWVDDYR